MRSKVFKRGKYYHCRFYDSSGKLYRLSTGETTIRKAERFLAKKEEEAQKGTLHKINKSFTFEEMKADYYEVLTTKKIKGWLAVENNLFHLEKKFKGSIVGQIDYNDILNYRIDRIKAGKAAPATVQRELSVLKRMMKIATKRKKIGKVPEFEMFKVKDLTVRETYFTEEEHKRVYNELPSHLKPVSEFAWYLGWRRGEILNLPWEYARMAERAIVIPIGYTKAKDKRVIPLDGGLWNLLQDLYSQRNGLPYVFLNSSRTNKINTLYPQWQNTLKKVGLEGRKFHDYRRSAAIRFSNMGISASVACKIIGWENINTYRRYRIVDTKQIEAALKIQDTFFNHKSNTIS